MNTIVRNVRVWDRKAQAPVLIDLDVEIDVEAVASAIIVRPRARREAG